MTNLRFLMCLYHTVRRAASAAVEWTLRHDKEYTVIVAATATSRFDSPVRQRIPYPPILYYSQDITLVGGAVLVAWSQILPGWISHSARTDSGWNGETRDLDLVWWPRRTQEASADVHYTAHSPAIVSFVETVARFMDQFLQQVFRRATELVHIHVEHVPHTDRGFHMIHVYFQMTKATMKVVDLAIHDTADSQHSTRINDMSEDPMYGVYGDGRFLVCGSEGYLMVPSLSTYLRQQLFSYTNQRAQCALDKLNRIKGRLRFIRYVLHLVEQHRTTIGRCSAIRCFLEQDIHAAAQLVQSLRKKCAAAEVELDEEDTHESLELTLSIQSAREQMSRELSARIPAHNFIKMVVMLGQMSRSDRIRAQFDRAVEVARWVRILQKELALLDQATFPRPVSVVLSCIRNRFQPRVAFLAAVGRILIRYQDTHPDETEVGQVMNHLLEQLRQLFHEFAGFLLYFSRPEVLRILQSCDPFSAAPSSSPPSSLPPSSLPPSSPPP